MTGRGLPEPTVATETIAMDSGGIWARWDRAAFQHVAGHHWPGAERVLPRLSRSADHGRLWFVVAAGLVATRGARAKRAALLGTTSLALASAAVNTLGKRSVRRARPLMDGVPLVRRLRRQPFTSSFPSGHAASAAAFATGVALESNRWGLAVVPLAASVAFSRVYTGVHYPGDVLAGAALGVGAAFAVRGLAPPPPPSPSTAPVGPAVEAPVLPDGAGLELVADLTTGSAPGRTRSAPGAAHGTTEDGRDASTRGAEPPTLRAARSALPRAGFVICDSSRDAFDQALERAARKAADAGGALGVYGGDTSIRAAVRAAVEHGVPLAVLPDGTRNRFAADLGVETADDVREAVTAGHAVTVDPTAHPRTAWPLARERAHHVGASARASGQTTPAAGHEVLTVYRPSRE